MAWCWHKWVPTKLEFWTAGSETRTRTSVVYVCNKCGIGTQKVFLGTLDIRCLQNAKLVVDDICAQLEREPLE